MVISLLSTYDVLFRSTFQFHAVWLTIAFQASDHPFDLTAQQINERIGDRIEGELAYLSGEFFISSTTLNKSVHQS
jgi:thermospermine synthase